MRVLSRLCTCLPWCKPSSLSPRTTVATLSSGSGDAEPLERAAALLSSGAKVVVMTGAGVSVSAGIPDFRTPGSGLYDNLQEYNLPYAEAIFDLDFFQNTPQPFYRLCKELWPGNYSATPTHRFIKLLHDKGQLVRCFTQNIDSLETAAGLPNPYGGQPKKTATAGEKTATEKAEEEFLSAEDSRIMNSPVRLLN